MSLPHQEEQSGKLTGKKLLHYFFIGAGTLFILVIISWLFQAFRLDRYIEDVERKTYDYRAIWKGGTENHSPSQDILIVKFDDLTLNMLSDEYGTWPWPRDVHAGMINFMNEAGSKAIAYDIMFVSSKKGYEQSDLKFIEAFKNNKNVYLSMNFDNDMEVARELGKGLTPEDIDRIEPLSIDLENRMDPSMPHLHLDETGFFDNPGMTFNNFRPIMRPLIEEGERISFINHSRDGDGVSRGNPLFFRFKYRPALKTNAFPLHEDAKTHKWYDKQNRPVTQDGYLLDDAGRVKSEDKVSYKYYPYMGLRLLMDQKFRNQKLKFTLTRDGHLQFKPVNPPAGAKFEEYMVPLSSNGNFLIDWHNVNVERIYNEKALQELTDYKNKLVADPSFATPAKQQEFKTVVHLINQFKIALEAPFDPMPYQEISAWEVIRTMRRLGTPEMTDVDRELMKKFKDKVVFVGTTAVATYDIKNTSIDPMMPGVILQANIYDNLMANTTYMRRVSPHVNLLITFILCLMASFVGIKLRSALAAFLSTALLAISYIITAFILFKEHNMWVNIAMPLVSLLITITLTFMVKYISRDKDYKKTYQLANTDSMTGLYNHRFFQEHMRASIEKADKLNSKFSLVLIDIDFFKKFNDTYGHQAGDEVLRHVARKLKASVRGSDVVARYGGEEMAVILDRATEEEALSVAHKLVKAIAEEAYPIAEGVAKHVTISVGVSTYPTHGSTPAELIEFSDQGLYRAKENGRNQVGSQYDTHKPDEPPSAATA